MARFATVSTKIILPVFVVALASGFSSAGANYAVVSKAGDNWTLGFEEAAVTTETVDSIFCSTRQVAIESAELWMPSMGHGTSPVAMVPAINGCTRIRDMNFLMRGVWELRVKVVSGDFGTFRFRVR